MTGRLPHVRLRLVRINQVDARSFFAAAAMLVSAGMTSPD